MLAQIDNWNLLINSATGLLTLLIAGYFKIKAQQFEKKQEVQGEQITKTEHNINSKNDALNAKVDALTETVRILTGEKATMVEQARDKSGDVPPLLKTIEGLKQ